MAVVVSLTVRLWGNGREVCAVGYGMVVWSVTVIVVVSCVLMCTGLSRWRGVCCLEDV